MITYPTDKLQKVVLGGKCEQRNLPSGYTQVEYIETTGTQYIDTGIIPTINTKAEVKFAPVGINNTGYWGARYDPYRFCCTTFTKGTLFSVGITNDTWPTNRTQTVLDTIYDCIMSNGYTKINGTEYTETPVTEFNITTTFKLGYIRVNSNSYIFSTAKYYICKLWNNGILVANLIPCRRNSDNVLGMFDLVSQTFLTNAGTGSFTAGPDIVPTPDTPMNIVCNNGVLKVSLNLFNKETLIDGYIEDTGNIQTSTISAHSVAIPVIPNTTYVLSGATLYNGNTSVRIHGYSAQDVWVEMLKKVPTSTPTEITNPIVFTTGSTDYFVRISYTRDNMQGIQLEQGSTATPYRPYGQIYTDGTQEVVTDNLGNTANAEMLLAVGNYKDTLSVLDGKVTRNVGIKVLDGTEVWSRFNNLNVLQTNILLNGTTSGRQVICNYLYYNKLHLSTAMLEYGECFKGDVGSSVFYINVGTYTNTLIDEWKAFLAERYASGNPVIIVYPLATATTEQVTPQPLAGNTATITAGSIDNLPIKTDIHANMKHRFITDANGKSRLVNKVYVGSNLIFEENYLVDMGLPSGTLWASRNIDITQPDGFAASPYQYECSFFSWGNVDGHNPTSNNSFSPYNWGGVNAQSPYYEDQVYGSTQGNTLTNDIPVGVEFDAARANLGGPWRMPTSAECKELCDNIIYIDANGTEVDSTKADKRVTVNSIVGIYIQSRVNGARLFFPCSGSGTGISRNDRGKDGYYWSVSQVDTRYAYRLGFNSLGVYPRYHGNRYAGHAVRPVI